MGRRKGSTVKSPSLLCGWGAPKSLPAMFACRRWVLWVLGKWLHGLQMMLLLLMLLLLLLLVMVVVWKGLLLLLTMDGAWHRGRLGGKFGPGIVGGRGG